MSEKRLLHDLRASSLRPHIPRSSHSFCSTAAFPPRDTTTRERHYAEWLVNPTVKRPARKTEPSHAIQGTSRDNLSHNAVSESRAIDFPRTSNGLGCYGLT